MTPRRASLNLLLNDDAFGVADRQVFETLNLGICDDLHISIRVSDLNGTTRGNAAARLLTMPGNWASPRWVHG